ncbi:MAG: hypothetical protein M9938_09415 [Solirubrobacterales bacterium]|nr:hypothetical protein [Solirubrobacterales bacterium]
MAQTKKKRRRKHRGTQAGGLETRRRRTRPKNRAEARNQARSKSRNRTIQKDAPPTWKGATIRGLVASLVFLVLLILLFKRNVGQALPIALFMLAFYIPAGYYMDLFIWRRKERAKIRSGRRE